MSAFGATADIANLMQSGATNLNNLGCLDVGSFERRWGVTMVIIPCSQIRWFGMNILQNSSYVTSKTSDLFAMDRRAKIPECFDRTLSVRPWPTPPQPSGGTLAPVVGVDHNPANCI